MWGLGFGVWGLVVLELGLASSDLGGRGEGLEVWGSELRAGP